MLNVRDLEIRYGAAVVVRGVSLDVNRGEIVALLGPNGAGKTSTLLAISGLVRPAAGTIEFAGRRIDRLRAPQRTHLGIVQVPEGALVFGRLTVYENLLLGAWGRDRAERRRDLDAVLARFPLLAERLHDRAGTLSGGQRQILAIARALVGRPRLLLMDEPSLGLAPGAAADVYAEVRNLRGQDLGILLVEQNLGQALAAADRAYVMLAGAVVVSGPSKALATDEQVRACLGGDPV